MKFTGEEKLTRDNCLCDACFRHVDRRANCPNYRKRSTGQASLHQQHMNRQKEEQKLREQQQNEQQQAQIDGMPTETGTCDVTDCNERPSHSLRKKWLMKVKKSVLKAFHINLESAGITSGSIYICENHYEAISHLMVCAVCKRKLAKNHIFYLSQVRFCETWQFLWIY